MKVKEIKCRVEITSKKLSKDIDRFLKDNKQVSGHFTYLGIVNRGIVNRSDKVLYSSLDAFTMIWKLTSYFGQVAMATIQAGDIALVSAKTQKNNDDTPISRNCGNRQCWFNAIVSTRTSAFSQSF